ncbi:MAG: hypothetical protein KBT36_00590 [Kurthia sp.]|nr:hypothetical protein [Candidatus Kurthia equi]
MFFSQGATIGFPNIAISINDGFIPLTKLYNEEPIHLFLNDLIKFRYVVDAPWGEITSEEQILDNLFHQQGIQYISKKQQDEIIETIQNFHNALNHVTYDKALLTTTISKRIHASEKINITLTDETLNYHLLSIDEKNEINGFFISYSAEIEDVVTPISLHFLYDKTQNHFIIDRFILDNTPQIDEDKKMTGWLRFLMTLPLCQMISYSLTLRPSINRH